MARKNKKATGKGLKSALLAHQERQRLEKAKTKAQNVILQKQASLKPKQPQKQVQSHVLYIPFDKEDKVLVIGDGDLSYSLSILQTGLVQQENLIITSYDSGLKELNLKYPNSAQQNYDALIKDFSFEEGRNLFFKVDCTKLLKLMNPKKIGKIFAKGLDCIVFNFPHTGRGIKDVERNIAEHQNLMVEYFKNCVELYTTIGKIQKTPRPVKKVAVTLFTGEPYDSWAIKELAKLGGLRLIRSGDFDWESYPSYCHRKTNNEWETTKPQRQRKARVYCFDPQGAKRGLRKETDKKKKISNHESDSE